MFFQESILDGKNRAEDPLTGSNNFFCLLTSIMNNSVFLVSGSKGFQAIFIEQ